MRDEYPVYEEHVICENCHYHFSFLFESSQRIAKGKIGPVATRLERSDVEREALRHEHIYANRREVWHPCPYCGYVQSWMILVERGVRLRDGRLLAVVLGVPFVSFCLTRALYDYAVKGSATAALLQGLFILGTYALVALAGLVWWRRYLDVRWNPNRRVTPTETAAARAVDVDRTRSEVAYRAYITARRNGPHKQQPVGA